VDTQALQLHDKVQKLIEQYTKDKQKMAELEAALAEKTADNEEYYNQISQLQIDNEALTENISQLNSQVSELNTRKQELELMIATIEGFADDLNSKIDDLIPQIENL
jgi:chromosome segregation ATPase